MITVFMNDWRRGWENKERIGLMFVLIVAAVSFAIYLSGREEPTIAVAFVGDKSELSLTREQLKITYLTEPPATSDLILGKYAGVIEKSGTTVNFLTLRGDEFKEKVLSYLNKPTGKDLAPTGKKGVGSLILGYLLMFLMMTSVTSIFVFSQDKEVKILPRLLTTPVTIQNILLGHSLFSGLLIFFPTLSIIFLSNVLFGQVIGLSLLTYTWLLLLICLVATSFSLMLASLFQDGDRSAMLGSSIVVTTTILAGSFISFTEGNQLLGKLIRFLPQKVYLDLITSVEQGQAFSELVSPIAYLIGLSLLFYIVAWQKTKQDYLGK